MTIYVSHTTRVAFECMLAQCVLSLTSHTLGKPGLEGSFRHHETCSVVQMEFITNKVRERGREERRGGEMIST